MSIDPPDPSNPLEYAHPENLPPPQFAMHWGGWIVLLVLAMLALIGVTGMWR